MRTLWVLALLSIGSNAFAQVLHCDSRALQGREGPVKVFLNATVSDEALLDAELFGAVSASSPRLEATLSKDSKRVSFGSMSGGSCDYSLQFPSNFRVLSKFSGNLWSRCSSGNPRVLAIGCYFMR